MRYDKRSGRVLVDVTDLARYAYQRENPRALLSGLGSRALPIRRSSRTIPRRERAARLSGGPNCIT